MTEVGGAGTVFTIPITTIIVGLFMPPSLVYRFELYSPKGLIHTHFPSIAIILVNQYTGIALTPVPWSLSRGNRFLLFFEPDLPVPPLLSTIVHVFLLLGA